eukprot:g96.t1
MGKDAVGVAGVEQGEGVDQVEGARKSHRRSLIIAVVIAVVVAAVTAIILGVFIRASPEKDALSIDEYVERPFGDVLIMRHALAPGGGDPEGFELGDCTTQRNLDSAGIAQATQVGRKLAASKLPIGKTVYTSQWCRCRDTARLIVAQLNNNSAASGAYISVEEEWGLNSFYQPERGGFTKDACMERLDESILGRLKSVPVEDRDGMLTLMVTHQVTVSEVTGVRTSSGEVVAYDSRSGEAKRLDL